VNLLEFTRRWRLPPWLLYAVTAAVCWGTWGVLVKGPSRELSGWTTQVLLTVALVPSAIVAFRSQQVRLGTNRLRGVLWGFFSGLAAGIGDLCFYLALQSGADTAIAIPIISLYPLITLAIAVCWFKERLNRVQVAGIVLAVIAITLLSGGAGSLAHPPECFHRLSLSPTILYTLAALICAGLFTAMQKLSTNHIAAELSHLSWCSALVLIAVWIVATKPLTWNMRGAMVWSALAAGALNGFGVIASFAAYRRGGKASVVAPLTAVLQPLVTVVLAFFVLGEAVGLIDGCGIVLAICAASALSRETKRPASSLPAT
jgi:drug/metabolite transporter (DMT)-like permease